MASSLSVAGGSSSPDTEPVLAGEMKSDLPIGRYFLYRLVEDQKDVGYKKLLSSDIISDAQRILLEYLDLPPQHAQEQDHSQGMLDKVLVYQLCQTNHPVSRLLHPDSPVHFLYPLTETTPQHPRNQTQEPEDK
jgi:hypothetical protein